MADIRCSNCGNNNPDFLDACQFCQSPLHPDDAFSIGEEPTKKDTGELEDILPSWLKDARQQNREDVGDDATLKSETKPKVQNGAPDLLAGLVSQTESDDDDVPDWLASMNPVADKMSSKAFTSDDDEPSDFFAQFKQTETKPSKSEPAQDEMPAWAAGTEQPASEPEPSKPAFTPSNEPDVDDNSWMNNLGSFDDAATQSSAEKEPEDLSWLHNLENTAKQADEQQASGGFDFPPSSSGEDLNWLNDLGGAPASNEPTATSQPSSSQEDLSWLDNLGGGTSAPAFDEPISSQPASSQEDMSWLNNLGGTPAPEEPIPSQPSSSSGEDLDWLNNLGGAFTTEEPAKQQPASSQEDMSWLNNLGSTPTPEEPVPSQPSSSSGEDLDWLNNLGGAFTTEEPAKQQPASSQEDMSWLNNLGGTPVSEEPVPSQPSPSSGEDLDWLDNLGGAPTEESVSHQPASSGENLDWLNNLGGSSVFEESAPAQPAAEQEDLNWLNALGGASSVSAFEETTDQPEPASSTSKPFQTAPLNELLGDEEIRDASPDWLKNAMEGESSMPSLDDLSTGRPPRHDKSAEPHLDELLASSQPEPASSQPAFDFSSGDSVSTGASDLDSLFNVEMPDWLSNEPTRAETSQASTGTPAAISGEDALSPVDLPSWVQAMRPVASSIDDGVPSTVNQVTEQEGPLAGFSGVIPSAPIGSSLRPKAFSLKLQVSDEQQAGAALFEQILAGETVAQPLTTTSSAVSSQHMLRWVLSGIFVLVLFIVLALGSKIMPIAGSNQLSNLVSTVPDSSQVLVVIDYDPSYAGELEVTGGPLFDQLARSKRATFNFISMSPNGSALVDRLMTNANIATSDGAEYQLGTHYSNLGFLPGGSAGVLGFIGNAKFDLVILMTDNAESGRVWVEQLEIAKGRRPEIASSPLFVVSSAQSAPMLQPYASSGQAAIVINGLYDAANYEFINNTRPGIARNYWDAFGIGLFMAIIAIVLGSVWNVLAGIRERRVQAEQG